MKLTRSDKSEVRFVLALVLVAMAAHVAVVPVGLLLHNSEWSAFLLVGDWFRKGHWSVFPFQNNYGGLTLTALRAGFTAAWDSFDRSLWGHARGHMVFSYLVGAPLMALASYGLLRATVSRAAARTVGLLCAVGWQSWVYMYGDEFYPLYLLMGFGLLALRGRHEHPFFELRPALLFAAGILAGHGLYAVRAMQLFILLFLVPWHHLGSEVAWLWRARGGLPRLGWGFLALFAFIEVFGRELGTWGGRMVKVDGVPNAIIGGVLLSAVWVRGRGRAYLHENGVSPGALLQRCALFTGGLLLGFLPELQHWLRQGRLTSPRVFAGYDLPDMLRIAGQLPGAFRQLVSGDLPFRSLDYADHSLGRFYCVALATGALIALGVAASRGGRRDLRAYVAGALLSAFAFCRVNTQFTEMAPMRYLYPLVPILVVAFGAFYDQVAASRWGTVRGRRAMVALLFLFAAFHLQARFSMVQAFQAQGLMARYQNIVETFRRAAVDIVVSDDFWYSNNLSVLSRSQPGFWGTWHDWGPPEFKERALTATRAGILLESKASVPGGPARREVELLGRLWRLEYLGSEGDRDLYLGRSP